MTLATGRTAAISLAAVFLLSCGGGGGDGGGGNSPPPNNGDAITLTEQHGEPVALLSFGPSSDVIQAVESLTAAARLLHQEVLVPQQFDCEISGHARLSAADEDSSGGLSVGDHVVVAYADCNQSIRGNLRLTITGISFEASDIVALEGDATIDFDLLELVNGELNGSGDLAYSATSSRLRWLASNFRATYSVPGQVEAMTRGRVERTYQSNGRYALSLSGTIDSDALAGNFTFATESAFEGADGDWPLDGRLLATGRRNSRIGFDAEPAAGVDQLVYEVDQDGDGRFELTNLGLPWVEVAPAFLFGIDTGPIGPEPPPAPPTVDAVGRRIPLGAPGGDLLVDDARGKIYVTVPARNELIVLSAHTLEVEQRVTVGSRPVNIAFSLDHEELLIALAAAGEVQVLDLETFASTRIFVAVAFETSNVNNAVETSPGILFAATGGTNFGSIARIDRAAGEVAQVPFFGGLFGNVELIADPARGVLYAGDGGTSGSDIYKLNATDPLVPLLAKAPHAALFGTGFMSLSPDGTRLYLQSGQVVETDNLTEIGLISHGTPWASDNGVDVVVGRDAGTLFIHSATTLEQIDSLTTDCALDSETHGPPDVDRIAPSPVDGQWLMLGGTILCAVDLGNPRQRPGSGQPGVPQPTLPVANVPVIDLPLGAEAFDAEFDASRNRVYVSLPDTGEIVTVDAAVRQVTQRTLYGNLPRGIDLSPDESTLAVIFNGNGHLGFVDLASGQIDERDLTAHLFAPEGHDVAYVSDEAVFASADRPGGEAYLVKTSRHDPDATLRVTGGEFLRYAPELAASPDGSFLFATESDARLFKYDLSLPDAPLVLGPPIIDDFFGADRVSVSPDGHLLALRGGKVVRTADFTQAGQLTAGIPHFSHDGAAIYSAGAPGRIDRFSSASFVASQRYQGNCSIGEPRRLLSNPEDDVLITVGQSRLCFWLLNEPAAKSLKVGPRSAYVCGTSCLARRHQRQTAAFPFSARDPSVRRMLPLIAP